MKIQLRKISLYDSGYSLRVVLVCYCNSDFGNFVGIFYLNTPDRAGKKSFAGLVECEEKTGAALIGGP